MKFMVNARGMLATDAVPRGAFDDRHTLYSARILYLDIDQNSRLIYIDEYQVMFSHGGSDL